MNKSKHKITYAVSAWVKATDGGLLQQVAMRYCYSNKAKDIILDAYMACPDVVKIQVVASKTGVRGSGWLYESFVLNNATGVFENMPNKFVCKNCGLYGHIQSNSSGDKSCDNCGWCENE